MRAGIYGRLSVVRPNQDTPAELESSTDRQVRDCFEWVARHGGEVTRTYRDEGLSGYTGRARPDFDRLVGDVDSGTIDTVVCWKLDRLTRNHSDFQRLWEVCERHRARLVSLHEMFDSSTPTGEFTIRMLVGMARMESASLGLRRRRMLEDRAKAGKPHWGGRRAYGWTRDGELVEEEAAHLRWAATALLEGASLNEVCRELSSRGARTTKDNAWLPSKLRRALVNPRMIGKRTHHGTLYPADWPPILEDATHRRLVALLNDPRRASAPRGGAPRHLLSGIARCAECGKPMWIRHRGPARPGKDIPGGTIRYACVPPPAGRGCGKVSIRATWLDELVRDAVLQALAGPALEDAARRHRQAAGGEVGRQLAADEEALEQLSRDFYLDRVIGRPEFLATRGPLEARVMRARDRLAGDARLEALQELPTDEAALLVLWESKPVPWRRRIVEAVLDAVVVKPAPVRGRNRLDPSRVLPDGLIWRA